MRFGVKSVIVDDLAWTVGLRLVPTNIGSRPAPATVAVLVQSAGVRTRAGGIGVGGGVLSDLRKSHLFVFPTTPSLIHTNTLSLIIGCC